MSVRYTGEALAMSQVVDDVSLRDVEHWKDRLEVRLDNRQVFFLFFGSAMVACLLFVLGVIVGKKLETRGHAEAPAIDDPLAILDRLGSQGPMPVEQAVTFPKALATPASPAHRSTAARAETLHAEVHVGEASPAVVRSKPAAAPIPAPPVPIAPSPAAHPAPVAARVVPAAPLPVAASGRPNGSPSSPPSPAAAVSKGRFTLQLSAYQDKAEAEAMAHRLGPQHAIVVASEIPGKGTWYRVRAGSYATFQEASAAKTAFERDHNVIAYVATTGGGGTVSPSAPAPAAAKP
jgi:hypothetical protein